MAGTKVEVMAVLMVLLRAALLGALKVGKKVVETADLMAALKVAYWAAK